MSSFSDYSSSILRPYFTQMYSYVMALETRQRLYIDAPLIQNGMVTLDRDQSHYIVNVIRMVEGEELLLFNGRDGEWCAEITSAHKKSSVLQVKENTRPQDQQPQLMLVFAPIKKARIDFIAEKATELGVGVLQPVMTDYTQVSRVNLSRLDANAIEAAEQTGRTTLMQINEPISLSKLLEDWPKSRHIIFCDEDCAGNPEDAMATKLLSFKGLGQDCAIFIGPEGGFSPRERELISGNDAAISVSLGQNVLRADTAMLAALSIWQGTVGAWKGRQ